MVIKQIRHVTFAVACLIRYVLGRLNPVLFLHSYNVGIVGTHVGPAVVRELGGGYWDMHLMLVEQHFYENVVGCAAFLVEEHDLEVGAHWRNLEVGPVLIESFRFAPCHIVGLDAHQSSEWSDVGVVGETQCGCLRRIGDSCIGALNDVAEQWFRAVADRAV